MRRLLLSFTCAALIIGCASSKPIMVSQSSINMTMLDRIKTEGATKCQNNEGLKGIEWPYQTTPDGTLNASTLWDVLVKATPGPSGVVPRLEPEAYVGHEMRRLGMAEQTSSKIIDGQPVVPTYVCQDGAQFDGKNFELVR